MRNKTTGAVANVVLIRRLYSDVELAENNLVEYFESMTTAEFERFVKLQRKLDKDLK